MSTSDVKKDYEEYAEAGRIWGQVPADRIKKIKFERASAETVARFLALPDLTTTVSDVLDSLGICGVIAGSHIPALVAGKKIVGPAVTLRSIPERKTPTRAYLDKEPIKMSTREIYYLSEPGDVLVADFGGNKDVSNMGGQSCMVAKTTGFAGAIVNGAVRDLPAIRELDYPVWATGVTPITGKFRMEAIEINGPVTVHNIVVYPGDLIVADDSGICVVPGELAEQVVTEAEAIGKAEDTMRDLIASKAPLSELRPLFRKRYD
ncbi:RraA family protein [Massilia niastensis]|uniref:RraA family protein n=1 Tax=Massilia niastensis TaxID=544911 RepID=UPI00036BD92F|nr:RraA family protein [Massilia niastensis]